MAAKSILLTNCYGPVPTIRGKDTFDVTASRLARGHYPYEMSCQSHVWGLHLIAENLSHRTIVLENPHWEDFLNEVKKNHDFVGIQIIPLNIPQCAQMVKAIRDVSPQTKIVVGGYGVNSLRDGIPGDESKSAEYILNNADYLCQGEGVRFMRELLGDDPVDRPIHQNHLPAGAVKQDVPFSSSALRPVILVGLGCRAGCDFCCTSAAFKKKKVCVADPAQLYSTMKNYQSKLGRRLAQFQLYDEDLFQDSEYVRELGRLIRSNRSTWSFRWQGFGSLRSLSQFEPQELFECGVAGVWMGVETTLSEDGKSKAGYSKRSGEKTVQEVISGLQSYGISITGSMILGFDFHTPANIVRDIDAFVALKPSFYQVASLIPCPGTVLYRKLKNAGRISADYRWSDVHLWQTKAIEETSFKRGELEYYYDLAHEKIRTTLGPPMVQIFENNVLACQKLQSSSDEFSRFHAARFNRNVHQLYPLIDAMRRHPPSSEVRQRIERLQALSVEICGSRAKWKLPFDIIAQRIASRRIANAKIEDCESECMVEHPTYWVQHDGQGGVPVVRIKKRGAGGFPDPFFSLPLWRRILNDKNSSSGNGKQSRRNWWQRIRRYWQKTNVNPGLTDF